MRIRVEYLDAVHDFIESADSSTVTTRMATPSDSAVTLEDRVSTSAATVPPLGLVLSDYSVSLQTMELCKELEVKAERLRRMQAPAEMTVTNLTPAQLIRQFRWELIGPVSSDSGFWRAEGVERCTLNDCEDNERVLVKILKRNVYDVLNEGLK